MNYTDRLNRFQWEGLIAERNRDSKHHKMIRYASQIKQERAVDVIFTNGDKLTWQPAVVTHLFLKPFAYNIETADGVEVSIPSSAVLAVSMRWVSVEES